MPEPLPSSAVRVTVTGPVYQPLSPWGPARLMVVTGALRSICACRVWSPSLLPARSVDQ